MVAVPFLAIALLAEPLAAWKQASGGVAWDGVRTVVLTLRDLL